MTKAATPCFTPRTPSATLSTIRIFTDRQLVGLRASDLDTIMHGVADKLAQCAPLSGYVPLEKTPHIIGRPLAGPGCLVESKHVETHSKRLFVARLDSQSVWARDQIHARNGGSK